jgi:hypothetical protein
MRSISALLIVVASCSGGGELQPLQERHTAAIQPAHPTRTALAPREFTEPNGRRTTVWIEPGREAGISTTDPCCGLWYDGNQYNEAVATCAPAGHDECADEVWSVHPGLAEDRVCGERRRCVPRPEARVITLTGDRVVAEDAEGAPLATGTEPEQVPYSRVLTSREGAFVTVRGKQVGVVAVDYGSRYTIYTRDGRIDRITRDAP